MVMLTLGVVIWSLAHFVPAVPFTVKQQLTDAWGRGSYRAAMAAIVLVSVVLMVAGWKDASPRVVFTAPPWADGLALVGSLAASILFFAPYMQNNLKRLIRHPQLTGILLWGLGHALASGQARALILFGGLAVWSLFEMILINRRDGPWLKEGPVGAVADLRLVLAGLGFFAILMFTHQRLFGVSPVPGF